MFRTFTKDKFLEIIQDHPAAIKKLEKPSPEFIARCLMCNNKVTLYIDDTWLTLPVLQALIPKVIESKYSRYSLITAFPQDVRDNLPISFLRKLCQASISIVINFPKAPYDLFLDFAKKADSYSRELKNIPVHFWTEDLILALFVKDPSNRSIPEETFTDTLVDRALNERAECINYIPEKFLTHTRLVKVFTKDPTLELCLGHCANLKNSITCWDQPLADMAMVEGHNLNYIPDKFITKDMCIKHLSKATVSFTSELKSIPLRLRDEDVIAHYFTTCRLASEDPEIPRNLLTPSFLLKLADMDEWFDKLSCLGVGNYAKLKDITPDQWLKVLKICPKAIQCIPKDKQTPTIINAFLESATIQVIDKMYQCINLSRITKDHAPFLIGTTVRLFQDIITRKMAPKPRPRKDQRLPFQASAPKVMSEDTVSVDLTDSDYLNFVKL